MNIMQQITLHSCCHRVQYRNFVPFWLLKTAPCHNSTRSIQQSFLGSDQSFVVMQLEKMQLLYTTNLYVSYNSIRKHKNSRFYLDIDHNRLWVLCRDNLAAIDGNNNAQTTLLESTNNTFKMMETINYSNEQ